MGKPNRKFLFVPVEVNGRVTSSGDVKFIQDNFPNHVIWTTGLVTTLTEIDSGQA